jgi:hypothetical protein
MTNIQPPVQAILHAPVLAHDFVESLGRQSRTQQIIGRLGGGLFGRFANAFHFANSLQSGPLMLLL